MATLSAAMVTLLTDNWAGAGATPTFGALIDYQKDLADTTEQVIVRLPIHEDVDPINDIYSNFKFTIQLRVKTTVDEDRLKVLTDETIRIINTYAIGGITRQFAKRGENTSDRTRQVFSYDVWANLEEHMSTGGTAYASPGAGAVTFPDDVTVAGNVLINNTGAGPFLSTGTTADTTDPMALLRFKIEREWMFRKRGTAGATRLTLESDIDGKEFWIGFDDGTVYCAKFKVHDAQADCEVQLGHDVTVDGDLTVSGGDIITPAALNFKVSGDSNDYLALSSGGTYPIQTIIGGSYYLIKSDDATWVGQAIGLDASHFIETTWHKGLNYGEIYSTHRIKITAVGNVGIDVQPTSLTLSNDTDTITVANIADLLMFGSANKAYVPMTLTGATDYSDIRVSATIIQNTGADDIELTFILPTPCNKGGLKLYISNLKYGLFAADGNDYLTRVRIYGWNGHARTQLDDDGTNHTAAGDKTFSGAVMPASAIDCSAYQSIGIFLQAFNTDAQAFGLGNVRMECYYAT